MRGQVSIEYLSYFSIFLIVAVVFTAAVYTYTANQFLTKSQARDYAIVNRVANAIEDGNKLAKHVDKLSYNVRIPKIANGYDFEIKIENGLVDGHTKEKNGPSYYARISEDLEVSISSADNQMLISKG